MTPLGIVIFAFAAFGLAYVIGYSKITLEIREWLAEPVEYLNTKVTDAHGPGLEQGTAYRPPLLAARWLLALMECPACLGWHIGFWASIVIERQANSGFLNALLNALLFAFFITGTNYILGRYTGLIKDDEASEGSRS